MASKLSQPTKPAMSAHLTDPGERRLAELAYRRLADSPAARQPLALSGRAFLPVQEIPGLLNRDPAQKYQAHQVGKRH